MLVPLTRVATTQLLGLPPYSVPVPAVAIIAAPATKPVVVDKLVKVAVNGLPTAVPTVNVKSFVPNPPPNTAPEITIVSPTT